MSLRNGLQSQYGTRDLQKCLGSKAVLSPNSKGTKKSCHREKKAAISIQTISNRAQQQHLEILCTLRLWSSSGVNELRCRFKNLPVKYIIRGHYSNESLISHLNLLSTGQSYNTVIPKKKKKNLPGKQESIDFSTSIGMTMGQSKRESRKYISVWAWFIIICLWLSP